MSCYILRIYFFMAFSVSQKLHNFAAEFHIIINKIQLSYEKKTIYSGASISCFHDDSR